MTTALKSRKATSQKVVSIVARYAIKMGGQLTGVIVYVVRSSKGDTTYRTTLLNGHATGCTCPANKPCYHMTQLETKEQQRRAVQATQAIVTESDAEYEEWKRENGLDHQMSREEYTTYFTPCEY